MGKRKTTFNISKKDNFSEWYTEILAKAEVVDMRYGVKGFVVIRPWGARIIDKMYRIYESALRATGHDAAIFPAVIPEKNFKREASHVDGFAPDVFWLDKRQGDDKLALRPTSETAFYEMYNLWIRSYRDLPLKIYQRANVFRSETKATRPLIRDREFHWIEAHDAFASKKEAEIQVQDDIQMTEEVMHKIFGIPFLPMKRPQWDTFPGAVYTVGSDVIMPDGKVIQQPSTHLIEQHFVKAFDVKFVDEKEKEKTPWLTCYGPCMSRMMASILAIHGDDNGLILPYTLAPVQVVIVPFLNGKDDDEVLEAANKLRTELMKEYIDVKVDDSDKRPGEKFFFWEMKGVPFRIDLGMSEINGDEDHIKVFLRDTKEKYEIDFLKDESFDERIKKIPEAIKNLGAEYDERLIARADEFFDDKVMDCSSKDDIKKALDSGKIARFSFCSAEKEGSECAEYVEKELQARVMGTRADLNEKASGKCPVCGKKNIVVVYAGKSY